MSLLSTAKPGDLEEVSSILDKAGNTLDYRKYGESIFEIFIIGGILRMSIYIFESHFYLFILFIYI